MIPAATRSRLLGLKKQAAAARRGQQLLEEKREALIRALVEARRRHLEAQARASVALSEARRLLAEAEIELGPDAVEAAGLAQAVDARITLGARSLLGVALPTVRAELAPFRIQYAPGSGSETLDRVGLAFSRFLPAGVALAQENLILGRLQDGLNRTSRRANALEQVILPGLERELRRVEGALEEEARDESVRTRCRAGRADDREDRSARPARRPTAAGIRSMRP